MSGNFCIGNSRVEFDIVANSCQVILRENLKLGITAEMRLGSGRMAGIWESIVVMPIPAGIRYIADGGQSGAVGGSPTATGGSPVPP
jgi:hypothetical protein